MEDQILLEAFIEFVESIYFDGFYQLTLETNPYLIDYEYIIFVDLYGQAKQSQNGKFSEICILPSG